MIRRMLITFLIFGVLALLVLVISYEVVNVEFDSFMENQPSIGYQEGPRLLPPPEAIPISRPLYRLDSRLKDNPVPADAVSLQRGEVLFSLHCAVCHGPGGQGDGPVTEFWREDARRPPDLTTERTSQLPDRAIYTFITQGIGTMPPLRENLSERQRWDVVNYLRTFQVSR